MKRFTKKHESFLSPIKSEVIYANDMVNLTYLPSKSCYAAKLSNSFEDKLKYIDNRMGERHESVSEHSNIVMCVGIRKADGGNIIDIINGFKYLNIESSKNDKMIYFLIGGSVRGYKHLIRETINQTNSILSHIKNCLYDCSYIEFFPDLLEYGVVRDNFIAAGAPMLNYDHLDRDLTDDEWAAIDKKTNEQNMCNPYPTADEERVEILNIDSIQTIYNRVSKYGFTMDQCLNMASVTILFKNMSRIITQQLTRHRNGITQESQRYVNYSESCFNSPDKFKPEKYDSEKTYGITLYHPYEDKDVYLNAIKLDELGDVLCSIYGQLFDQGLAAEDARGYLPQNVQSTKVFMTFTYKSLLAFLKLRTDSHAQAEIREYANTINIAFKCYLVNNAPDFCEDFEYYNLPRCLKVESPEYNKPVLLEEDIKYDSNVEPDGVFEPDAPNNSDAESLYREEYNKFNTNRYSATREEDSKPDDGKKDI